LCIAVFSVGAYYGVEKIRGGSLQVRAVSVIDSVQGQADATWATTYTGIFAPSSDSYRLTGNKGNEWWSAVSPTQSHSQSYYDRDAASRNIYCVQQDGGSVPWALPINIWSMQCLLTEAPVPVPRISAKVERSADGELTVTITNLSDCAISRGWVLTNSPMGSPIKAMKMRFDNVPPHSTKQFTGRDTEFFGDGRIVDSHGSDLSSLPTPADHATRAFGAQRRTDAIQGYLADGGVVIGAYLDQPPLGFSIRDRSSNVNHIQLVRLVLPHALAKTQRNSR
jgi:hypothetical protein